MKVKLYKLTGKGEILISENDYPNTIKEAQQNGYYPKSIIDLLKRANVIINITEENAPKKEITKTYKKALEFSKPQQKVLKLLNINNSYLNTYIELYVSIKAFENNPLIKHKKQIEKVLKEIEKEKVQFENNYFYKEYERENNQKDKELQKLNLEIKTLLGALQIQGKHIVKQPIKNIKLTLNNNFDSPTWNIGIIHKETQPLFISNLEQWANLFSDDIKIFKKPIELKPKTTLSDFYLFFKYLYDYDLIKKEKFFTILENTKAFSFKGKTLTAKQITDGKQNYKTNPDTRNKKIIDNIFNCLKVTN